MIEASDAAKRAAQRLHEYGFFAGGSPVEQARNIIQSAIDEALAAQAGELERIREEANRLIGYCLTCKNVNKAEWMHGLVRHLNMTAEALGDPDRAEYRERYCDIDITHPNPEDATE